MQLSHKTASILVEYILLFGLAFILAKACIDGATYKLCRSYPRPQVVYKRALEADVFDVLASPRYLSPGQWVRFLGLWILVRLQKYLALGNYCRVLPPVVYGYFDGTLERGVEVHLNAERKDGSVEC